MQCPEADVKFFDRIYRTRFGKLPSLLKEDFCGTANLSCQWAKTRSTNRAIGVDLHRPTLEYGRRKHLMPLGASGARVELRCEDVREVRDPKVDIVAAMNFSYFVFKERTALRSYFENVRRSLRPQGMFILDIFGGWEAQQLTTETKELDGFDYRWQQVAFDPITHDTLFHIHFKPTGAPMIRRAFVYDWRFWTVPEVRETLLEAGFRETTLYWEGTERETGEGNGVFRPAARTKSCPGWIAYIAAF